MNETALTQLDRLAINADTHAMDHGAILYAHGGRARVHINLDRWDIGEGDVLVFFPGDVVRWEAVSSDFRADAICYSPDILRAASLHVEHAVYEQLRADRLCGYPELIHEVVDSMFRIFRFYFAAPHFAHTDRIVTLQLQLFFLGFYDYVQAHPQSRRAARDKGTLRREELYNRFMELLEREFRMGREVGYYASRMNITRKYLGIIVREKMGVAPKRVIDDYLVLQLKLVVSTSKRSLKQIAADFHFSDQSALTRYFRQHVGVSPQQFRHSGV